MYGIVEKTVKMIVMGTTEKGGGKNSPRNPHELLENKQKNGSKCRVYPGTVLLFMSLSFPFILYIKPMKLNPLSFYP